ncbi:MAG: CubicO group peptidase (beta-lactamase class C family) [Gammaproteobacteria bacterium]|jgi:CubicO group peptidase (beta-lactamase class C family)
MDRRRFLYLSGCAVASATVGCHADQPRLDIPEVFIREQMMAQHIPGLAVAIIKSGSLHWAQGFGWADVARQKPMTSDTLMNIGSLAKTFVTTAVMQCVERGECGLDDDINAFLDFSIHNPMHDETAITILQLLTHHSSIADGSSYGRAEEPPDGFEGPYPDCIYDHPNFGDGFLRTSVSQLVNYQLAMLHNGEWNGRRILASSSIKKMLAVRDGEHGITWNRRALQGGPHVWGHGGGDPGISTAFDFDTEKGDGVIIFANTWGASLDELSIRLFRAA